LEDAGIKYIVGRRVTEMASVEWVIVFVIIDTIISVHKSLREPCNIYTIKGKTSIFLQTPSKTPLRKKEPLPSYSFRAIKPRYTS